MGYNPEIILSGRRVNDSMGLYVVDNALKLLLKNGFDPKLSNVLIMGFTFKENCPDIRNTKVIDIYNGIKNFGCNLTLYDPIASSDEIKRHYGIDSVNFLEKKMLFDLIIVCVNHNEFHEINFYELLNKNGVFIDVKNKIKNMKSEFSL